MVLELNRDDKGEKLELVKMKLRDIVNLYFIKVTKNDARLNIDTHKEKLKEMFNQFFDKQESLKVSKPLFFGQAIPLRVRNIYFTEYLIIND
jgi:flagellar basal body-associated protein FliL